MSLNILGDMGVSSVGPHSFSTDQKEMVGVEILMLVEQIIL